MMNLVLAAKVGIAQFGLQRKRCNVSKENKADIVAPKQKERKRRKAER